MKNELQTGDILHCRGKKLLARLIMKFTGSEFSHSALVIRIENDVYIVDAQKDGVNLRPFDAWESIYQYKYVAHRRTPQPNEDLFRYRALSKVGHTGYDFEGLILRQPFELITGRWRRRKNEGNRMYCSEFVAWCYRITDFYSMSPEDLYRYCVNGYFLEIGKNY